MLSIIDFKGYLIDIKNLKTRINKEQSQTGQLHKKKILFDVECLANRWFDDVQPSLLERGFTKNQIEKYDKNFLDLLKLSSSKGNKKDRFLSALKNITDSFTDDIIINVHIKGSFNSLRGAYDSLLESIQDKEQSIYLKEAIDCAKQEYYRAAIVLGWCAAIDHVHKKIDQIGFTQFNVASARMASARTGRFKRFNKMYNISSLDDLCEVFDNDILWVVEGMNLIDPNQHTRLKSCFDMRNHCAHPGEAPITSYNVMSFFSDINEIIFKNIKFN